MIGLVLAPAAGVALSPFPVVAVILVLGSSRPRANGVAFALGWLAALSAVTAVFIALADGGDDAGGGTSTLGAWLRVAVGVLLLALAARKWLRRQGPGTEPEPPAWLDAVETVEPRRALGLGALLGGANPKNLALTLAAATAIAHLGLDGADAAVAGLTYVVLASSTVVGAVGAHLLVGARAEPALASVKGFMLANSTVILVVVLVVLGVSVLAEGIAAL